LAVNGPLTPALSLRERELKAHHVRLLAMRERELKHTAHGSLSLRGRAGARGPFTTEPTSYPSPSKPTETL